MLTKNYDVIPAKAGIQFQIEFPSWIPAFAGMTDREQTGICVLYGLVLFFSPVQSNFRSKILKAVINAGA